MSRIRGIEVKVQKEVLQTRKYGLNEILNKKRNEDQTIVSKDDTEKVQINELLHKLPKLDKIFDVHRKIGEGTFSSVYLGSLRQHANLQDSEKRWFALKHLVPTAHPARIEHELKCLQDMGGRENVIGVELCLRHMDTIVFVMPYIPHRKFSEYVGEMDARELRQYMRALMVALRHVHSFGVIHRDVKPSNFLYDRENRRYLLVDFGLAQRLCVAPDGPRAAEPPPPPPPAAGASRKRPRDQDGDGEEPEAKRAAPSTGSCACACAGRGGVCGACAARPAARAPRAGTQGFRPPEVLLKWSRQSTAVDAWAAGVVLLSALTARYPLLRAAGDLPALAELAHLLGSAALERAAAAMGTTAPDRARPTEPAGPPLTESLAQVGAWSCPLRGALCACASCPPGCGGSRGPRGPARRAPRVAGAACRSRTASARTSASRRETSGRARGRRASPTAPSPWPRACWSPTLAPGCPPPKPSRIPFSPATITEGNCSFLGGRGLKRFDCPTEAELFFNRIECSICSNYLNIEVDWWRLNHAMGLLVRV